MTHEEKQLLLQDLSARLPYGVKGKTLGGQTCTLCYIGKDGSITADAYYCWIGSKQFIPYLRSMSSMTEDERKEFKATQYEEVIEQYPCSAAPNEIKVLSYTTKTFDWLNEHYFDFRGLIKKGLAIEAPKEMY